MPKRWTQRPPGSTWGDWGDDDELGRINLVTPAKVLEGVREVTDGRKLLPELAARLSRRHGAEPAAPSARSIAPTEDIERRRRASSTTSG